MKLKQLLEKKKQKGIYAGVRFDDDTAKRIKTFIEENEIPNGVPNNKLHTTVLYSKKHLPNFKAADKYDKPLIGKPTDFDVWKSQPDEEGNMTNCLILLYDCQQLIDRHESLMKEHNATFDYDEYNPHITLSYNIGDMSIDKLDPADIGDINIVKEYQEELKQDWAKNNT